MINPEMWRFFLRDNLKGDGLEIGALDKPFPVNGDTTMKYADFKDATILKQQYGDKIGDPVGVDYVCKSGQYLPLVKSASMDFVCNCHLLEHLANPGMAIAEWLRVVKKGGIVYVVVPDKRFTFDKERPLTDLDHLKLDYKNGVVDIEYAHYEDYIKHIHVGCKDLRKSAMDAHKGQGSIHVHVWDFDSFGAFVRWLEKELSFTILDYKMVGAVHIGLLMRK